MVQKFLIFIVLAAKPLIAHPNYSHELYRYPIPGREGKEMVAYQEFTDGVFFPDPSKFIVKDENGAVVYERPLTENGNWCDELVVSRANTKTGSAYISCYNALGNWPKKTWRFTGWEFEDATATQEFISVLLRPWERRRTIFIFLLFTLFFAGLPFLLKRNEVLKGFSFLIGIPVVIVACVIGAVGVLWSLGWITGVVLILFDIILCIYLLKIAWSFKNTYSPRSERT
jgi:hypothetical protein